MALSGVHVACCFVGGFGINSGTAGGPGPSVHSLIQPPAWSETLTSAGTTTNAAPTGSTFPSASGYPSFEIRAAADVYVAIGPNPNASTGPRIFVPANETRNLFCQPGDKLAWILVP